MGPECTVSGVGAVVEVVKDLPGLDELAVCWDSLAARSGMPTQHHGWARACAETLLTPSDRLSILVVRTPDSQAIAPLVRRRGWWGRLEVLGMGDLYEPADFLYSSQAALDLLAEALVRLKAPFFLGRIPADSPVIAALKRACSGRTLLFQRPACRCPLIPLDESWLEPQSHLNAGRRGDLRRARRIADGYGPLTFEMRSPTAAELPDLLEEAVQVEGAGWKGRSGSSMAKDPLRGAFYHRFASLASLDGCLRLCFLRIDGRAVAVHLAVECGGAFSLLKIGYDESFARCSPGSLLLLETIREAASRRLRSFEFLGIPEPWTQVWTTHSRPHLSLRGYPVRGAGLPILAADSVLAAGRRVSRVGVRRLNA